MKYLVFKHIRDDYDNELLSEITVPEHINTRLAVIEWLPTLAGSYEGTSYLVVKAELWDVAVLKEKPIKTFAEWVVDGGEE